MSHTLCDPVKVNEEAGPTIAPENSCPLLQLPTELLIDIITEIDVAYRGDASYKPDPLIALRL